jgi:hemerythrin-like metal-binding protein
VTQATVVGWRTSGTQRQEILKRAEDIDALKTRGRASEALDAEHGAIELVLHNLTEAVLSGSSRAEVIEILDTCIAFCATHFADEEGFMRASGNVHLDAHATAHKGLTAQFVRARRCATGEGLSVATLDEVDLLHALHTHVSTWDRGYGPVVPK